MYLYKGTDFSTYSSWSTHIHCTAKTMQLLTLLLQFLVFNTIAFGFPVEKRIYQPTSGMFSLIAHHKGAKFQYHLVKNDGTDLKLVADDKAFFGRIKANNGYILNVPRNISNVSLPSSDSVYVKASGQLSITKSPVNASQGFGIEDSLLTYRNSTSFLACPDKSYRGEYSIYSKKSNTSCPSNSTGYDISLLVQQDATYNYNPKVNVNSIFRRLFK